MKNKFGLWVLILFIFMSVPFSYGQESSGEKKEGKSGVFDFVESVPGNSAKDVKLDGEIELLFNKNVVNFSVKDNNENCFSIKDAENKDIPIDVIFADDQVEPDKKREIILKPKKPFDENTTYTVHISPKLKAKNGDSLDRAVTITFTTLSLQSDKKDPPAGDKPEEKPIEKDNEKPASTVPDKKQDEVATDKDKKAEDTGQDKDDVADDAKNDSDVPVSSDDPEDEIEGTDQSKGELSFDSQLDPSEIDDDIEEQKDSGTSFKKYIWIAIAGAVLVLAVVLRKKL